MPAAVCARKPRGVAHFEAASLPLVSITAVKAFRSCGLVERRRGGGDDADGSGPRVFVTGGAGGVGTAAIQLAKLLFGASHVATTASPGAKTELCRRLGADRVVNYREERKKACQAKKRKQVVE